MHCKSVNGRKRCAGYRIVVASVLCIFLCPEGSLGLRDPVDEMDTGTLALGASADSKTTRVNGCCLVDAWFFVVLEKASIHVASPPRHLGIG